MPGRHTEHAFETAIEHHLTSAGGYTTGTPDDFDPHRAIFPADVLSFIQETQSDEFACLGGIQKNNAVLRENRTSLISATVTGRLDVRGGV